MQPTMRDAKKRGPLFPDEDPEVAGACAWREIRQVESDAGVGHVCDGFHPDRFDVPGGLICLIGVGVIMYARRSAGPPRLAPRSSPAELTLGGVARKDAE